jgi:signal transduction histidine kinase
MSETTIQMPLPSSSAAVGAPMRTTVWQGLARDTGYCLSALLLAVPGFAVAVAGVSAGLSLVVLVVGLPVLAVTAYAARGFAHLERQRVRVVLRRDAPLPVYDVPRRGDGWFRRVLTTLRDPQSWFDILWCLLGFVTAVVAASVALAWWVAALGGVSAWFWMRFIPLGPDSTTLAELVGLGAGRGPEIWLNTGLGLVALATLVPVLRGAALLHAHLGSVLLSSRAELQQEMTRVQGGRTAARVAEADALRRLERDIHDGPQQRLVRLALDLGRARKQLDKDPEVARGTLDDALRQARETVDELRALSRGIAPPLLVDRGLTAALGEVSARSLVPVHSSVEVSDDLPDHAQTAVYFVVSEALTNVAKHSGAGRVTVTVRQGPERVLVRVTDDGRGGAHVSKGHGLAGLEQRVRAADGTLTLTSPEGGPTTLEAEIACG